MARRSRFNGIPADLARKGDCGAALRAVEQMTPGVAQDYEAGRVEELCAIGTRGASLNGYIVRSAEKAAKSSWSTEIVQDEAKAIEAARRLSNSKTQPVCVFDSKRWEARPVCFKKGKKVPYMTAPVSKTTGITRGPLMKRLGLDKQKMPVVHLDGFGGRNKIVPTGRVNEHVDPAKLDCTSTRMVGWDTEIKVWNSRKAMARAIRMQENRGSSSGDWRAAQPLSPGEGFDGLRAMKMRCKPIDPKALARGAKIEQREHRLPKKFAARIAKDHLCVNSNYYKKAR